MNKIKRLVQEHKILLGLIIGILIGISIINSSAVFREMNNNSSDDSSLSLKTAVIYESGTTFIENTTVNENLFVMKTAVVYIINSTVDGSIYVFDSGTLIINTKSNITVNVICSDTSDIDIDNSTIGGIIECRDSSNIEISSSQNPLRTVWKFDSANLTIFNCSFAQLNEFGIAGEIIITNSTITNVMLNGLSITYINNSTIPFLNDKSMPFNLITGPTGLSFDFMGTGVESLGSPSDLAVTSYKTSEHLINVTWIGWDSPIIDGYMNMTFQILVDGELYATVNGSGFHNSYDGSLLLDIPTTGEHNISIMSIDQFGNNYTSQITIEIIDYPEFQWILLGIGVIIAATAVIVPALFLRYKKKRGYYSSLAQIFKKEVSDSKIKIIAFLGISAAPGLILLLVFGAIQELTGSIGIDDIRMMINVILSFFYLYFGMVFSIVFTTGSIISAKRDGSLSWFLSKPVRRWEFLWGKTITYLLIAVLISITSSVSITLSGLIFVDEPYIADMVSIGGYLFLISLITLIPVVTIGMLCSSVFKKSGLAVFIPILLFMILPTFISFLPMLIRNEWPLLLSYSYYGETLGMAWVSDSGGGLSSLSSTYTQMFGFEITTLTLSPIDICIILILISIICMIISTFYFKRTDIP